MTRFRHVSLIAGAVIAAAASLPAAAQGFVLRPGVSPDLADPSKVVREAVVQVSDLDPASPAGAETLLRRIEAAADAVCGGADKALTPRQKDAYDLCRGPAVARAVARIRSPALSELVSTRQARWAAR